MVDLTGSSPESSPTSRSGPSERNNTTLAYWRKYNKDPRAAPVVAAALEYYRFRLITGDIWADKDTRRFLAGASLNDAMDVLEYERFEPLDGMVEAVSLFPTFSECVHLMFLYRLLKLPPHFEEDLRLPLPTLSARTLECLSIEDLQQLIPNLPKMLLSRCSVGTFALRHMKLGQRCDPSIAGCSAACLLFLPVPYRSIPQSSNSGCHKDFFCKHRAHVATGETSNVCGQIPANARTHCSFCFNRGVCGFQSILGSLTNKHRSASISDYLRPQ